MNKRKFSLPYNGKDPEKYLRKLKEHINVVDSVFLGIDSIAPHHLTTELSDRIKKEHIKNSFEFLKLSKGLVKRLLTFNQGAYGLNKSGLAKLCAEKILPIIKEYGIEGVICTNYIMAKTLHNVYPELEIHTSCNCFQWNIRQMELWRDDCGVTVFNPPREILRSPAKLKEMHDAGFKIKAIVNESCLYGCPETINHCMAFSFGLLIAGRCDRNDEANFFRSNWVIPRWLDKLDEYVDIYKIAGRGLSTNYIFNTLEAYKEGKEVDDIREIVEGGTYFIAKSFKRPIPSKDIPDKLLTCECKECNKTCFMCRDLVSKYR
jgi:collagenase-like PrtC family protease